MHQVQIRSSGKQLENTVETLVRKTKNMSSRPAEFKY